MKKITTIFGITLFLLSFLCTEKTFSQTNILSENFESGTANAAWGTYWANEEKPTAIPMAQAPNPLATGGNYVGYIQDINFSMMGTSVILAGSSNLQNYSIEGDVYCYVGKAPSAYTGLCFYSDSTRKNYIKMAADFKTTNPRIRLSHYKSDPTTMMPTFDKSFLAADIPGGIPATDGWHHMKVEIRTTAVDQASFTLYFDGQMLVGCPISYSITTLTDQRGISGLYGFYCAQNNGVNGIAGYFDNIIVTQLVTSVEDNEKVPTEFSLLQNYPNPFNPETQISYKLSTGGFISLSVYDLLGRKIKTLVSKDQPAGSYTVNWNGKNEFGNSVPSGVYMYSLKTSNFYESKKMILMK